MKFNMSDKLNKILPKSTVRRDVLVMFSMEMIHLKLLMFGTAASLLYSAASVGPSNIRESVFKKSFDLKMDLSKLSTGWKDLDLLSCVSTCLRNHSSCYSVTFDKRSKHCTPGSWVFQTSTRRDDDLHLLYSPRALCGNTSDNFMREFDGLQTCLLISSTPLNYESSRSHCQEKGAKLYTIKVPEKLEILGKTFTSNYDSYWVGLINSGQGVLRWIDGGPVLTMAELEALFRQEDLQDYSTHTRCVIYITRLSKLGFADCNQLTKFLCEK